MYSDYSWRLYSDSSVYHPYKNLHCLVVCGSSNREFCRQHGISEKSFYYWLRKLRHQAAEAAETHLIKLDPTPTVEDMLHIRYHGAELRLPSGVDMDVVAALLRSIQSL